MIKWLFINRSIRTKIVWSSVIISLIPMLVLSYLFYQTSTRSLERTMIRSSDQNAEYLTNSLDQYFRNISSSALEVYGFSRVTDMMEHGRTYNDVENIYLKETLQNYYRLVRNKNKDIIKIMVFGKENVLEDAWVRAESYNSIKFDESIPHYEGLLDLPFQHSMLFTYSDITLQQDFFVYTITIYDPYYKNKYGSLIFYIQKKALTKMFEANNRSPNVIVLQNASGETFYQTNEVYANIVKKYQRPESKANRSSHVVTLIKNKDLLIGTANLDNSNIGLTIIYPNTELAQNRKNTLFITIGAFVFVMLIISLFSLLAQQYITRPIQLLGKAMKAVRSGNFHVTLKPYRYRDDLSELTRNFNFMTDKIRELIELEFQMQLRNKEAQILALQMQINPHFLYNTLQTIGGKAVLVEEYEIHEMCRALGDMFRYSFYEGNTESTIGQELVHVNNYLYIQKLRFEDSLLTDFEVQPDLMEISIIRFVLQPIIENIIVHALGKQEQHQLLISVRAIHVENTIMIIIRDDGPGIEPEKLAGLRSSLEHKTVEVFSGVSIGLKNVHERIRLVYGSPYGLEINSALGTGTEIRIRIPYKRRGIEHV